LKRFKMATVVRLLFLCLLITSGSVHGQLFSLLSARVQSSHSVNNAATVGSALATSASKVKPTVMNASNSATAAVNSANGESLHGSATSRMAFLARMQPSKLEQKDRWTPLPNRHSELLSVASPSSPAIGSTSAPDSSAALKAAESSRQPDQVHPTKDEIKLYNLNAIAANSQQQFHIGYIKASDLQKVIASGFQLRELHSQAEPETAASGEPLMAAAAGASGKTSPRKSTDKLRLARLQAAADVDLQTIAQKDISNQPIMKEALKSTSNPTSTRKSPVSPKQAHFGLREKKQKLAQLNVDDSGSGATKAPATGSLPNATKSSSTGVKDNFGTKGRSNKSNKSRKSPTKNLIAARTVPFGSDLFSSTTTSAPTSTSSTSTTTTTTTTTPPPPSTTTSTTTTTTTAARTTNREDSFSSSGDSLSSSLGTTSSPRNGDDRETNDSDTTGSTEDESTTNSSTDSIADAVARSGKLVLAGITEEEEDDEGNNSLAAIAQQLNQNFGGFGFRTKANHSEVADQRSARLETPTKGGAVKGEVKGKQSDSMSTFKSPSVTKKMVNGAVKGRSRNDFNANKVSRKAPESFLSTTAAFPSTGSAGTVTTPTPTTLKPFTMPTTTAAVIGTSTKAAQKAKSSTIESEDEDAASPAEDSETGSDDEGETDQNDEFTLIGANLKVRNQDDLLMKRRVKSKQRTAAQQQQQLDSGRVGSTSWNGDEPVEGDYEGFDDLNEVELIDTNRPSAAALRQASPSQLSGCCSCAPLQSIVSDIKPVSLETAAQQLGANALFERLPEAGRLLRELVQKLPEPQFTVLLPSSEAVERLPKSLISRLKRQSDELRLVLANHVVIGRRTLAELMRNKVLQSRATRTSKSQSAMLRVNVARNETATVNGQRLLLVDQPIVEQSRNGLLHLIDGLLYPIADRNLLDTLKACNKFDGFVTLAQGTGLSDVLEQGNCISCSSVVLVSWICFVNPFVSQLELKAVRTLCLCLATMLCKRFRTLIWMLFATT
jgi:hypothetical protein